VDRTGLACLGGGSVAKQKKKSEGAFSMKKTNDVAASSALFAVLGLLSVALLPVQAGAQSAAGGETLFKQRCAMCHTSKPGAPAGMGPNLSGLSKRKAGTGQGFAYSAALKKSGMAWTKANLDQFLTAPAKVVPGTRMVVATPNPEQRAGLVAYLLSLK